MPKRNNLFAMSGYKPPIPPAPVAALDVAGIAATKEAVSRVLGSGAKEYHALVHEATAETRLTVATVTASQVREVIQTMANEKAFETGYGN